MRPLCIATLLLAMAATGQARAETDPVDDLRSTLESLESSLDYTPSPAAIKAYEKRVKAAIEKVNNPSDLCRALLLHPVTEARNEGIDKVRQNAASQIAERAIRSLRASLADEDPARRLAALVLIGQTANALGTPFEVGKRPDLKLDVERNRAILEPLAADVEKTHEKDKDVGVRRAALTALYQLRPSADLLAAGLGRGMKSKEASERLTSARLIGDAFGVKRRGLGKPREVHEPRTQRYAYLVALVPQLVGGVKDRDAATRHASLEALAGGIDHVAREWGFAFHDLFLRVVPDASDQQRLREWAQAFAETFARHALVAKELDLVLTAAAKSLDDEDLSCRLMAHKAYEQAATARYHLRQQTRKFSAYNDVVARDKKPKNDEEKDDQKPLRRIEVDKVFASAASSVPALVKSLEHKEVRVRLAALYVLETLTVEAAGAVEPLAKALADEDRYVRWGAARALRNVAPAGAAKAVPALARALEDDSADVSRTAAAALARYAAEAKAATPALTNALAKGDDRLRLLAAQALGTIGPDAKDARLALATALRDEKTEVRAAAASALGRTGPLDAKSKEALVKATEDPESAVSLAAAEALLAGKK